MNMFTRKQNNKHQGGYSLVEVLVAITVLLVALVGPLTIAQTGIKRSAFSREQTVAVFLAQEGTEAIVKLREDAAINASAYDNLSQVWGDLSSLSTLCPSSGSDSCGVTVGDDGTVSVYQCSGTNCNMEYNQAWAVPYKQGGVSGDATNYTRELKIDVDNAYAHVTSVVSWGEDANEQVSMNTYVYNVYYER